MYEPEVDDYVVWDRGEYGKNEGWVYFKGDPVDNELRIKQGWNPVARYITIETGVRDKPREQLEGSSCKHSKVHTLLLCCEINWNQLKFIKKRNGKIIHHYSEYDDVSGIEENSDKLSNMYKSQDGRLPDY